MSLFGVLNNNLLPKERDSSKTGSAIYFPLLEMGLICFVLPLRCSGEKWAHEDQYLIPVAERCLLPESIQSFIETEENCPGATLLPTKPVPTMSLKRGQGKLSAKAAVSSFLPWRAM